MKLSRTTKIAIAIKLDVTAIVCAVAGLLMMNSNVADVREAVVFAVVFTCLPIIWAFIEGKLKTWLDDIGESREL